ncbi:MAG: DUF1365 domain-containing protein [Pseudomonadota bacterium]
MKALEAVSAPLASGLYQGHVRHRRFAEREHAFEYRLFMVLLDLDEIERVCALSPFWSAHRFAPVRFRRDDFLPARTGSLREAVLAELAALGGFSEGIGAIRMLTNLRCWGLTFNPLTVYYCYAADGETLRDVLLEVHNTPWNERHCYRLPVQAGNRHVAALDKQFHVSPFLPMDMQYVFRFNTPGEHLGFHMENQRAGERAFDATLSLRRHEISRASLGRVLLQHPWMSARVLTGIYLQALALWLKGVRFHTHPSSLEQPATPASRKPDRQPGRLP